MELALEAYEEAVKKLETMVTERNKGLSHKERVEEVVISFKTKHYSQDKIVLVENELSKCTKEVDDRTLYLNIAILYMSELFLPVFQRRQLVSFYSLLKELINTDLSISSALYESWNHFANDSAIKDL